MLTHFATSRWLWCLLASACLTATAIRAAAQDGKPLRDPFTPSVYKVLRIDPRTGAQPLAKNVHPLVPALRYAYAKYTRIDRDVRDYTCAIVRQERFNGKLRPREYLHAKIRHQLIDGGRIVKPFGVYVKYLAPRRIKGREILYVDGQNEGRLVATMGGGGALNDVTLAVDPNGSRARNNSRYPITDIGFQNLGRKLIEVGMEELEAGIRPQDCVVKYFYKAKLNDRVCTVVEVTHPVRRKNMRFHIARIFIDDELDIPVRFASYGWPQKQGDRPPLVEVYTYLNVKLNVGLSNDEFDRANPKYRFRQPKEDASAGLD